MSRTHRSLHRTADASHQRARAAVLPPPLPDCRPPARRTRYKSVRIGRTRVGSGVFARRRYQAAAIIGEILGDVIDDPDYGSRYCMSIGGGRVLEPQAPFRYVNHSCEPNCEFDWFDLTPPGSSQARRRVFLLALREIKPGEELTIGYNWPAEMAIPCRCGAATCCGWIVAPDQLAALEARHARCRPPAAST